MSDDGKNLKRRFERITDTPKKRKVFVLVCVVLFLLCCFIVSGLIVGLQKGAAIAGFDVGPQVHMYRENENGTYFWFLDGTEVLNWISKLEYEPYYMNTDAKPWELESDETYGMFYISDKGAYYIIKDTKHYLHLNDSWFVLKENVLPPIGEELTLLDVLELSKKGEALEIKDFEKYLHTYTEANYPAMRFYFEGGFSGYVLTVDYNGKDDTIILSSLTDYTFVDIEKDDIDEFLLKEHVYN